VISGGNTTSSSVELSKTAMKWANSIVLSINVRKGSHAEKTRITVLVAGALLAAVQGAFAEEKLFKNYVYQTPLAKFAEATGYYDCSEDVSGTARCIDDVDFLEEKFTVALIFSGDKLMMVSLDQPVRSKPVCQSQRSGNWVTQITQHSTRPRMSGWMISETQCRPFRNWLSSHDRLLSWKVF